jgi:hypothetical protein
VISGRLRGLAVSTGNRARSDQHNGVCVSPTTPLVTQLQVRHPRDEALLRETREDVKQSFIALVAKLELRDRLN